MSPSSHPSKTEGRNQKLTLTNPTKTARSMTGDNEDKLDKVLDDIVEAKCSMKDLKIAEKEATESAKAVVDS